MQTLIFRTITPLLTGLMLLFSLSVLLRGHNYPGGGFIGGLIAVSAFSLQGISFGSASVRFALYFRPLSISGFGLFLSILSGVFSLLSQSSYLTSLWYNISIFSTISVSLSSVLLFDIGVYLVVIGSLSAIILSLEEEI